MKKTKIAIIVSSMAIVSVSAYSVNAQTPATPTPSVQVVPASTPTLASTPTSNPTITSAAVVSNSQVTPQNATPSNKKEESAVEKATKVSEQRPIDLFDEYKNADRLSTLGKLDHEIKLMKKLQEYKDAKEKLEEVKEDEEGGKNAKSGSSSSSTKGQQIVAPAFNPVIKGLNSGGSTQVAGNSSSLVNGAIPMVVGADGQAVPMVSPFPTKPAVYSIMGFDGDFTAKVSLDGKSVYSVKAGDVLPDGQKIKEVTKHYVLVVEQSAIGRPVQEPQKIYVTGKPLGAITTTTSMGSSSQAPTNMPQKTVSTQSIGITPSASSVIVPKSNNNATATKK